jgi:hypothetical protein
VSLRWPEDEAPVALPRRTAQLTREPLDAAIDPSLEAFERKTLTNPDASSSQAIYVALAIGILVLIGALLFLLGPLPTIFPPLACGDCGVLGP